MSKAIKNNFEQVYQAFGFSPGGRTIVEDGKNVLLIARSKAAKNPDYEKIVAHLNAGEFVGEVDRIDIVDDNDLRIFTTAEYSGYDKFFEENRKKNG